MGILPNSYDVGLAKPPQREATFRRNVVRDSGTVPTPRKTPLGGFHGIGIGVIGGVGNVVEANEVTGSARYGIVVVPAIDREGPWVPANNRIAGNHVSGSGIADIAMSAGSGTGNCFAANIAAVLDPPDLGARCPAEGAGSQQAAATLALPPPQLDRDLPPAPPYRTMPVPGKQASMPADARAESVADLAWLVIPAALVVVGLAALGLLFRRRRGGPVSPSRG